MRAVRAAVSPIYPSACPANPHSPIHPQAGVFILSLSAAAEERHLTAAALFAALLCLKHIFLYAAPPFFVFLLRRYCVGRYAVARFAALGAIVTATFGAAFGPFIAAGQLPQVRRRKAGLGWEGWALLPPLLTAPSSFSPLPSAPQLVSRLFPFARGLCHAYWAPNVWALYAAADKALSMALGRRGTAASMTGGLVGVAEFAVLPQVGSGATAAATLLAMAPCLARLW